MKPKESGRKATKPKAGKTSKKPGLKEIWSREEALSALKRLYLAAMEGTLERVVDKSGAVTVQFNSTAASTATKAIEAANKMMGYQKPDEAADAPDTAISVEFFIDEFLCR